jgi:hypothetical protein
MKQVLGIYEIELIEIKDKIKNLQKTNPESEVIPILHSNLKRLRETQRNINNKNYWY